MTRAVVAVVVAGIGLALLGGLSRGFDPRSLATLGFVVAFGVLGIVVARKAGSGDVSPAACPHCGGVVSPTAPYCKHCRSPLGGT